MPDFDFSNPTARERAIMAQGILTGLRVARGIMGMHMDGALLSREICRAERELQDAIQQDLETVYPQPGGNPE